MKPRMNETWLTAALVVLALVVVMALPGAALPAAEIITLKILYIALLLAVTFSLIFFLRGTAWDFYEEIVNQHNVAGAIFVAALVVSVALVIGS